MAGESGTTVLDIAGLSHLSRERDAMHMNVAEQECFYFKRQLIVRGVIFYHFFPGIDLKLGPAQILN